MITVRRRHAVVRFLREVYFGFLNPIKKLYWFVVRPDTRGVKTVVTCDDKILLVRIGYGSRVWTFPGGGVDRGEELEDAARREVKEESGVDIEQLRYIGELSTTHQYKHDTMYCYAAETTSEEIIIDAQEIVDAGWFTREELPAERSKTVETILNLYDKAYERN